MKGQRHFYDPPTTIREVPGVVKRCGDDESDTYTGSAEALATTGLLSVHMLPGQPGRAATMATYRARVELPGVRAWLTPGHMTINRTTAGLFRVRLIVSIEEQDRRRAASTAAKREREARRAEEVRHMEAQRHEQRQALERKGDLIGSDPEVQRAAKHLASVTIAAEARISAQERRGHLRLVWSATA